MFNLWDNHYEKVPKEEVDFSVKVNLIVLRRMLKETYQNGCVHSSVHQSVCLSVHISVDSMRGYFEIAISLTVLRSF